MGFRIGDDGVGVGRGEAGVMLEGIMVWVSEEGMRVWVSEEGKRV